MSDITADLKKMLHFFFSAVFHRNVKEHVKLCSFLYLNMNIFLDLARNRFKLGFHTTCQIKKEVQIKEGKVLTLYCMREIEVNWHMNIYARKVLLQALGLRFKQ